ncbi:ROK family protein [Micropruina sonneratiae]|uniref:ROK family protein n=1 Tax=Micropruina sonneratiae TaxID=2986940 RepID=UPI0022275C9E|nr:ROK family protein [Micropruina sp. KQZ13P-5]MCW3156963.1 ROK family protein [Micropruina sp. KQZ13P-5]
MTVIAVDIGGTKTAAARVDSAGGVVGLRTATTPARHGPQAIVNTAVELVHQLDDPSVSAVAVAAAGVIDSKRGVVVYATDLLRDWAGTRVADQVTARVGRPTYVLNDVHAHALGEAIATDAESLLLVAAGTGLGGGIVHAGRLLTGAHHCAGHLGHAPCPEAAGLRCSCGGEGHLECLASGSGLVSASGGRFPDAKHLAAAATAGDPDAAACLERSGAALGRAIGGWVNLLDPDIVVVTGGLADSGELWWGPLLRTAAQEALPVARPVRIQSAHLGASAALVGAAAFARSRTGNHD